MRVIKKSKLAVAVASALSVPTYALAAVNDPILPMVVRANTTENNVQEVLKVAADLEGNFVAVWQGNGEQVGQMDADGGIFFQRYDYQGNPLGAEVRANTTTANPQQKPDVAMDQDGDFVVVWEGIMPTDSTGGIVMQRFAADGTPQGSETLVNINTAGAQTTPAVAMDLFGNGMVVWATAATTHIQGRGFDSAGVLDASEMQISETAVGPGTSDPDVAMDADGDFVVVWERYDGGGYDIYARRYNPTATSEAAVNDSPGGGNPYRNPAVDMDDNGNHVIVWDSSDLGLTLRDVFYRRFDIAGNSSGPGYDSAQQNLMADPSNDQTNPSVSVDADGDFIAVWEHLNGSTYNVFGRGFSNDFASAVSPQGASNSMQVIGISPAPLPDVATAQNGAYVSGWQNTDANLDGVFIQYFEGPAGGPPGPAAVPTPTPTPSPSPTSGLITAKTGTTGFGLSVFVLALFVGVRRLTKKSA